MKTLLTPTHLICTASLLMAATAHASEEIVTLMSNGQEVVGTLALPDGGPAPVVLLLHGFSGSRDELVTPNVEEGVFAYTAQKFADNGLASLRIDFRGSGESVKDINYAQTTFESQVADALAAVAYLQGEDAVDGDKIAVLGWSQGGLVASATAGRSAGDEVDVAVLWNAVADPEAVFTGLLGADVLDKGLAAADDEGIQAKLPWGADIELNGAFFDGIDTFDPKAEIAAYSGPLLVVQGLQDAIVDPKSADVFLAAHSGEEVKWTAEMDHVFNVFADAETLATMVDATTGFLKSNLK